MKNSFRSFKNSWEDFIQDPFIKTGAIVRKVLGIFVAFSLFSCHTVESLLADKLLGVKRKPVNTRRVT